MIRVGHIALFVHNLREAETFYQHLFDMELLMRETEGENSLWYTLPMDKGWEDAIAAGIELKMVALKRDNFILPLFQGSPAPKETVLEIGVVMTAEEAAALRNRLPDTVTFANHPNNLMFDDPFGYRWHIWPVGNAFISNGEGAGRWLEI
jgi:catechol 2,3-dioxygenase-like lactoylglutathione lyase family enzyme